MLMNFVNVTGKETKKEKKTRPHLIHLFIVFNLFILHLSSILLYRDLTYVDAILSDINDEEPKISNICM